MGVAVDPLGDVSLLWLSEKSKSLCNCIVRDMECANHLWTCSSTPIWASMPRHEISDVMNDFARHNLSMRQTEIKCAICGRRGAAKDFDVIKKNAAIYKAVCPSHNRKASPKWVNLLGY